MTSPMQAQNLEANTSEVSYYVAHRAAACDLRPTLATRKAWFLTLLDGNRPAAETGISQGPSEKGFKNSWPPVSNSQADAKGT
jgi:hypothetical protein